MKAVRLHDSNGPQELVYEDAPQPHPDQGQALVRVYAVEVTPAELTWSTNWKTETGAEAFERPSGQVHTRGKVVLRVVE